MAAERRLAFGEVAELYDLARPSYPSEMADEVMSFGGAVAGDRALDVGAGTGKATELFLERGLSVLALEPSTPMLEIARRRLSGYEAAVTFANGEFEQLELEGAAFRLVLSGQAWHWIQPEVGYRRAAEALTRGGALAVFWNRPVWEETPLASPLHQVYERLWPDRGSRPGPMQPVAGRREHWMTDWHARFAQEAGFGAPVVRDYGWWASYTTAEYLRLLQTHSDHVLLESERRAALLGAIGELIETRGGRLELRYRTRLLMAQGAGEIPDTL